MENVPPAPPVRLWSLDALRGLCALIVFLSHWHLWSNFAPHGAAQGLVHRAGEILHDGFTLLAWPTGGHHPAVIGFFVLSGFCIHYPFERRARLGAPAPDWRDYFRRRFLRIMPVYWAACALGAAFVAAETLRPSGAPLLQLHATGTTEDFVVRFLGVAGVYPREIFAGNYILTTVTVEMLMYAAYPLFHRFAGRGQWRALGGAFVALHLFAILLLPYVTPYWVFNSIFMLGLFWYAGALGAHLFLSRGTTVSTFSLLLAWLGFLAVKGLPYFYGLNLLKQLAWALVCTLGILWTLRWEGWLALRQEGRLGRMLRFSGEISYSLYAVHTPVIMLVTWALWRAGSSSYPLQLAATLAGSIAVTLAVHYGIERVFYGPRPVASAVTRPVPQPVRS